VASALLVTYVLLRWPAWHWLALVGALVPILAGWCISYVRSLPTRTSAEAELYREMLADLELRSIELVVAQREMHDEIARLDRAERSLSQQNAYLTALHTTTLGIIGRLDLDDLLHAIVESAGQLVGTPHGFLHLSTTFLSDEYDPEDTTIDCRVGIGAFRRFVGYHMDRPRGASAVVWETQRAVSVDDFEAWNGHSADSRPERVRAEMVAPLKSGEHVVGVIGLGHSAESEGTFGSEELEILGRFAELASIALDNARLHTARERLVTDLDAFAHTVAHDLQGLLTMIVGYGQILLRDPPLHDQAALRSLVTPMVRTATKMSNILDELLILASVRRQRIRLGPFDMDRVVAEAEARLRDIIEEHQAEIVKPTEWPEVLGYGPWVEEIWTNYLSNAVKYGGRPDEGVLPRVVLGYDEGYDGGAVRFWVRDNGKGIAPETQVRLFTPFTRLDEARAQGHGLGLSIVKRIAEKLGGEVGVTSEVGEGSVFSFTLPAAPASSGVARDSGGQN
jgi:signal transduction histidine kinase